MKTGSAANTATQQRQSARLNNNHAAESSATTTKPPTPADHDAASTSKPKSSSSSKLASSSSSSLSNKQNATTSTSSSKGKRAGSTATSSSSHHYHHHHHHHRRDKPAELYRTDFITAMKLPDTESLDDESYLVIKDQWKIDWEKDVQVPVKPHGLNRANYCQKPDQYPYTHTFNGVYSLLNPKLVQPFNNGYSSDLPPSAVVPPAHYNNLLLQNHHVHAKGVSTLASTAHQKENKQSSVNVPVHKMPKKYLCPVQDRKYQPSVHEAYITHRILNDTKTNRLICRYDCDEMDLAWLNRVNYEFQLAGIEQLTRVNLERLIENFEQQSYESLKAAIDKLQSYSIEYDEGVVCDVCRSPDSEDSNEMVFCDGCNMCVHQACYGIEKIPQGNWLCAPCSFGGSSFKPECVLCPNMGGAMKATRNLRHWCHVSCALWIPETGFGNPDKMEPIINLNQVAPYRWQLVCNLCKEKRGCCLQCSEKRCHSAFHVTCAFKHNLEMENTLSEDRTDIEFKAYCVKHSRKRQLQQMMSSENVIEEEDEEEEEEEDEDEEDEETEEEDKDKNDETITNQASSTATGAVNTTLTNDSDEQARFFASLGQMNETERKIQMLKRMKQLNAQFYKDVDLDETISALNSINFGVGTGAPTNHISRTHAEFVFNYWKLKRRFNKTTTTAGRHALPKANKALMYPKCEEDLSNQSERMLVAKVRMFILLRQNLERVRTLTYMVVKREKLKRQFFEINHQLFEKQAEYLSKYASNMHHSILSTLSTTSASNSVPMATTSPSTSGQSGPAAAARSGRIRDILQIKNENCIYDYPALWRPLGEDEDEETVEAAESAKTAVTMTTVSSPVNTKPAKQPPVNDSTSSPSKQQQRTSKDPEPTTTTTTTAKSTATSSSSSFKLKNVKKKFNSVSSSSSHRIKDKYKNIENKKKAAAAAKNDQSSAKRAEKSSSRSSQRLSTLNNTSKDSNIENLDAVETPDSGTSDQLKPNLRHRTPRVNGFSKENGTTSPERKSSSPPLKRLANGVLANELLATVNKSKTNGDPVEAKRARLDTPTRPSPAAGTRRSVVRAEAEQSSPKKLSLRSSATIK